MAPASKKARKEAAPKPAPGGGLAKFFGGGKTAVPADIKPESAPQPAPESAPKLGQDVAPESTPQPAVDSSPSPPKGGSEQGTPASDTSATTAAAAQQPTPAAGEAVGKAGMGGLTDLQKQRIEENRRKALERQQAKKSGEAPPNKGTPLPAKSAAAKPTKTSSQGKPAKKGSVQPSQSSSQQSPAKTSDPARLLKRSGSDITPEKGPSPLDRRIPAAIPAGETLAMRQQQQQASPPGCGDRFRSFGKVPWMQYNTLYAIRLEKLRSATLAHARSLWSDEVPATNFLPNIAAKAASSNDVVVIGATFKDMPSRDNIIDMYRNSKDVGSLPVEDEDSKPNLSSDADVLWLEDQTARIQLDLPSDQVSKFATGFVVAVRGRTTEDGKLAVRSICLTQGFMSTPLPPPVASQSKDAAPGPYLALLSGLLIGAPDEDSQARNRALDFLLGRCESEGERKLAQAVQHVVVCGDVFWQSKDQAIPPGLEDADKLFSELASKLPTDVMPGQKDPSNWSLPQLPMHPYLFRSARNCKEFKSVSNPYQCTVGGLSILGHAGQPVRDLMRCTSISTPLQALTTCLDAGVVAPTAPDTLGTQPFNEADPFVIDSPPQLLFSGGHSQVEYEWRALPSGNSGTLCVCVPAFHRHPAVVLVNMRDPRDVCVQEFSTKQD